MKVLHFLKKLIKFLLSILWRTNSSSTIVRVKVSDRLEFEVEAMEQKEVCDDNNANSLLGSAREEEIEFGE